MSKKLIFLLAIIIIISSAFLIFNSRFSNQLPDKAAEPVKVALYFSTQDAMYLKAENRSVPGDDLYRNTLEQLIAGPESSELNRTIPEGVKILGIEIKDKIAFLNFSKALIENHWGGSTGELLTVYSIVNTMTQFPEIDQVSFLIEGEEVATLVGHMDLSRPLVANEKLIAE